MRIRFTVSHGMGLIAVVAVATASVLEVQRTRRVEHYKEILSLSPLIGSRAHFRSPEGWRAYQLECARAQEYLGLKPRGYAKTVKLWADEDERRYQRLRDGSAASLAELMAEIKAVDAAIDRTSRASTAPQQD